MLLQRILGMGSHVKWGQGQGKLAKAAAAASASNHSVAGQWYIIEICFVDPDPARFLSFGWSRIRIRGGS